MTSHILIVADQESANTTALRQASRFISGATDRISVLAFIDTGHGNRQTVSHGQRLAELELAARKYLGSRAQLCLDIIATPDIAQHCAEYCRQEQVTLVIKTGHRSESLAHSPLDWQLIRLVPCPVIIAVEKDLRDVPTLLVTLDVQSRNPVQKALDRRVVEWAGEWTARHRSPLYVACCIEAADPLTSADVQLLVDLESRLRPVIEPEIRALLSELSVPCQGVLVGAGSPSAVIGRLADELDVDLVVTGYTERHGLAHALLGHTAEKLMHRLHRNLVVVPARPGE